MGIKQFIQAFTDNISFGGLMGTMIASVSPLIKVLTPIGQLAAVIGGVILVYYSIKHKRLQIEHLQNGKGTNDKTTHTKD